jgi:hypothetical protein
MTDQYIDISKNLIFSDKIQYFFHTQTIMYPKKNTGKLITIALDK